MGVPIRYLLLTSYIVKNGEMQPDSRQQPTPTYRIYESDFSLAKIWREVHINELNNYCHAHEFYSLCTYIHIHVYYVVRYLYYGYYGPQS